MIPITVPTITLESDANGAPHPDPAAYARKFTGPYEHNGMFRTLSNVVGFYEDARGGRSRNPNVSSEKLDPRRERFRIQPGFNVCTFREVEFAADKLGAKQRPRDARFPSCASAHSTPRAPTLSGEPTPGHGVYASDISSPNCRRLFFTLVQ